MNTVLPVIGLSVHSPLIHKPMMEENELMKKSYADRVVGLVLAGGLAERMGDCKVLLPIGDMSALELVVGRMKASGIERIIVVTGGHEERIHAEASRLGCRTVYNPAYKSGMFSSILAGVRALPEDAEAFLLLPADTPLIKISTYKLLITSFYESCGNPDIVYPTFAGKRGHPPVIGRTLFERILKWHEERGLRSLLEEYPNRSIDVPTADRGTQLDMDTPSDYETLLSYSATEFLPDEEECMELLSIAGTPERVIKHMRTVMLCASRIAEALIAHGHTLDLDLLFASCMLHDIAKGERDHEIKGANWLRKRGYVQVADVVSTHKDLPERGQIGEAEILYLADKLTDGDTISTLKNRLHRMEARFASGSDDLHAAKKRIKQAAAIQKKIEGIIGEICELCIIN